jgi:PKD repeat protein
VFVLVLAIMHIPPLSVQGQDTPPTASIGPEDTTLYVPRGTTFEIRLSATGGSTEETIIFTMEENDLFGPEHVIDTIHVYPEIGATKHVTIGTSTMPIDWDYVIMRATVESTGQLLDTSSFTLYILDPGPHSDHIDDIPQQSYLGPSHPVDSDEDGVEDTSVSAEYDISFEDQTVHVTLNIQLIGDDPGTALRDQWEDGIEGIWSNTFDLHDGSFVYPIQVEVNWVSTNPHWVVTVIQGTGTCYTNKWYTSTATWPATMEDEVKAHEAGHMMGLCDEYVGGGLCLDNPIIDPDSIMGQNLGDPRARHYTEILEWLTEASKRALIIAPSPTAPYPSDDPPSAFSDGVGIVPFVLIGDPYTVEEGFPLTFDASATYDPDGTIVSYEWDFGDGSTSSNTPTPTHTYGDSGVYMVTLTVTDDDGLSGMAYASATVNNVAPDITTVSGDTIDENGVATVAGTFTDPGILDTFEVYINWGDGAIVGYSYPAGSTAFSETHQYLDDNPSGTPSDDYTVIVYVEDDDLGSDLETTTVTVHNVAPTVDAGSDQTVYSGDIVSFSGSFTDPGTEDTHTVEWDFGDGSPTVTGTLTPTHTYLVAGDYTVTLTVTDDDGGVDEDTLTVSVLRIPVPIDIKPGSYPNSINSKSKGVIPVAILNDDTWTPFYIDPVEVDPPTVEFGPDKALPLFWAYEDVDNDGDIDLILFFKQRETGIKMGDTHAILNGDLKDGRQITGQDSTRTSPRKS